MDWQRQKQALRDPLQILGPTFEEAGLSQEAARSTTRGDFLALLQDLDVVLLVTREYENLVVALRAEKGKLVQTFMPVPHPSGLAIDRQARRVYLAATRNPNLLMELVCRQDGSLTPSRYKVYPGHYYFHDLVFGHGKLYANSVGQNGVIEVKFDHPDPEPLFWWPRSLEDLSGQPQTQKNFLQLNSIALGTSWEDSFLTASSERPAGRRPWHKNYPVDGRGVVFSATTREVAGRGLTRPHSARFHQGRLWVNNSGYGQLGYFEGETYRPVWHLGSWTRGLAFHPSGIAWVGLSRVLDGYSQYAPGLSLKGAVCGIAAVCLESLRVLGSLTWPGGNQIFAIEWIDGNWASGFAYRQIRPSQKKHRDFHFRYQVKK